MGPYLLSLLLSSSDSGSQLGLAAHPNRSDKIYRHMLSFVPGRIFWCSGLWSLVFGFLQLSTLKKTIMSPALAAGAGAASKDVKRESATARLLGSGKIKI